MNDKCLDDVDTLSFHRSDQTGQLHTGFYEQAGAGDSLSVGNRLDDRYRITAKLGRGGMGQVFVAHDERLDRQVAIKVLYHDRDVSDVGKELEAEARMGASLQHPNIAAVYDFGFSGNQSFTVFEYVDGKTLRQVLEHRGTIPLEETKLIIGQLGRALDYAHSKGIIHRDLKPENACSTGDGLFKVLDLGLARDARQELTSGIYSGTPSYSSPEQASCQAIDGRADQYSLGVICYELLTGVRPFQAPTAAEMLLQQIRTPPKNPREINSDIPEDVAEAIMRSLAKNPDERFATCQEFASSIGDASFLDANPVVGISASERVSFYICHTAADSITAGLLCEGLERSHFSCWVYQRDALPAVPLSQQIRSVLSRCHAVLVLISRASLQSPELISELSQAHQTGRVLFPLLLDLTSEEFDAHKTAWRPMFGPGRLLQLQGRDADALDDMIRRLASGAEALGIQRRPPKKSKDPSEATRMTGRSWATDANQIDIQDLHRVVFRTEIIDDFLRSDNKTFLSATKGLGKTLLLTFKRRLLASEDSLKRNVTMIPEGRPYLDFMTELRLLSVRYHQPLANLNTTKRLWSAAFRISVLSHQSGVIREDETFELDRFPQRIRRWISGIKVQPTVVFKELTSTPVSDLNRLIDETENFLDQKMRSIHGGTFVFVDKVDQAVRQLPRQAWVNVQAGLIEAAWEMMNANSHIRIFATIREEAFANYESDVKSNLFGATTRLHYSEHELSSILDQLAKCYEGSNSFRQFIGLNVTRHAQRPDPEDSYQFVRRHTFGRPRDLVAMASAMASKRRSLSEDQFRKTVHETAATSLVSNIFDEMQVFLSCLNDRENRQRFLAEIPRNVLTRDESIRVCEQFNDLAPGTLKHIADESTDIHHPFRDLYLAGLLGVVEVDHDTGKPTQRFRQPQDVFQDVGFELPDSDFYLIHPALNTYISQHRTRNPYYVHHQVLLGHGQIWESYYGLFCEVEKQLQADLAPEVLAAGHRLLGIAHTQLKSNLPHAGSLYPGRDMEMLQQAAPATDDLIYWLEELREMAMRR